MCGYPFLPGDGEEAFEHVLAFLVLDLLLAHGHAAGLAKGDWLEQVNYSIRKTSHARQV